MRRPILARRVLVVISMIALLSFLGCGKGAPPAAEVLPPAPVVAVPATEITIGAWTDMMGTTSPLPDHMAKITAVVEGRVLTVLGDGKSTPLAEGAKVKAGQIIAQLDDRVTRLNLEKLQASLADMEEQHKQAQYAVESAGIEVRRLDQLKSSSTMQLVSAIESQRANLSQQDAQSKLVAVTARENSARSDMKSLETQLDQFTLHAPLDGYLGMMRVVPGQTLAVGTLVGEVIDLDEIDVICFAPPSIARQLQIEQPARIAGDKESTGRVVFVDLQAQADTGCFAVKVRFPNADHKLRASAIVRVQVQTEPERERIMVPWAALMEDSDPPGIVVVHDLKIGKNAKNEEERTGIAEKLQAIVGVRDRAGKQVEILQLIDDEMREKLAPRDALVVIQGANGIQNDDKLILVEPKMDDD